MQIVAIPDSTLAAVLHGPRDLRTETRPIGEPGSRQVLVSIAAVGICGSDVHYYEHGRIGQRVVRAPLVIGHEASGRVAAVGAEVSDLRVGDRVALEPGASCRRCRECRAGRYNLCTEVRFLGTPPVHGALANHVVVDADLAFRLPASVSDEGGALIEPLAVAVWACRKAGVGPGANVLVTGAGPIGLLSAQVARASGAGAIVVTDVNASRLRQAEAIGSVRTLDVTAQEIADTGIEFDAVIECSGNAQALAGALPALRPAGSAVLVGMGADELTLPLDLIQRRELWVTGTFRYANVYPAAIALAAEGRVDLDGLITDRYPLEEADAALRTSRDDPNSVKVLVLPASSGR